eukprot:59546_1
MGACNCSSLPLESERNTTASKLNPSEISHNTINTQLKKSLEVVASIHDIDMIYAEDDMHLFELDDAKIDDEERRIGIVPSADYAVNYKHVHKRIAETHDSIEIDNTKHKATKLLSLFDQITITNDELSLWAGYSGQKLFTSKENARERLKTVLDYTEKNKKCSKHIKTKARIITKLILEKGVTPGRGRKHTSQYTHILLLLASHGNVCNVMKETAISDAYGIMTNKLDCIILSQTLEQQIAKTLRDHRILLVEQLFHSFGFLNNTHYIAGFHNTIAKQIGVIPYNDPNIQQPPAKDINWEKGLKQRFFKTLYTKEMILQHLVKQINEQTIGYQKIVKYFEDNCPKSIETNRFLQKAIDIDTGKIKENYLCWLLHKMEIFMIKTAFWTDIRKCWDDIQSK